MLKVICAILYIKNIITLSEAERIMNLKDEKVPATLENTIKILKEVISEELPESNNEYDR